MGLLLSQFVWLHRALQILGGGYLLYIGIRIWRQARQPVPQQLDASKRRTLGAAYRYGALTNLTNPKAMVFFTTIFATLMGPNLPLWVKAAGIGMIFSLSTTWHVLLATLFSHGRIQQRYRRSKTAIGRMTGGLLSGFGIHMMLSR
jgi:threonine/homoserine/homoserine lactone efflux protein